MPSSSSSSAAAAAGSSSSSNVRYLDIMTCRSSNPMAVGSSASLLPNPLYLSDMTHVDVKLSSTEVAGPAHMFYPDGRKSVHMRQKLEDAIWERVAMQQAGIVDGLSSVGSGELSFSSKQHVAPVPETKPPKIFNPPKKRSGILLPKPKPVLFYSRPQGVDESASIIKRNRRLESKLQNLCLPSL